MLIKLICNKQEINIEIDNKDLDKLTDAIYWWLRDNKIDSKIEIKNGRANTNRKIKSSN